MQELYSNSCSNLVGLKKVKEGEEEDDDDEGFDADEEEKNDKM